ncbi:MAG: hypothetical protein H6816_15715 [Phycisphaerales bacterium]|nr:hypothetical protein [Phycisphaerales bacterium]
MLVTTIRCRRRAHHDRVALCAGDSISRCASLAIRVLWLALLVSAPAARAQPALTEAYHVEVQPGTDDPAAAGHCGAEFADPLNASGAFLQRASDEVRSAVSTCTEEVGGPQALESCLTAMVSTTVDYVVFVDAANEQGTWVFRAEVFDTRRAAFVFTRDEVSTETSGRMAAREACDALGREFVGDDREVDQAFGLLEVMVGDPPVAQVWVDGEMRGMSGSQLALAPGTYEVEVRAADREVAVQTVTIERDRLAELRLTQLAWLPRTVVLRTNVAGADVLVEGVSVGTMPVSRELRLEVGAGAAAHRGAPRQARIG